MFENEILMPLSATAAVMAAGAVGWHRWRGLAAARRIDANQHNVLLDAQVRGYEELVEPARRGRWYGLFAEIERATDGAVRLAHVVWAARVINHGAPACPIPSFAPPAGTPYRIQADAGVRSYARFLDLRDAGRLVEAFRVLENGAAAGSPMCMGEFGLSLVLGYVPGREPDAVAGLALLEQAVAGGHECATLGLLLIEGEHAPRDTARGLALLERAAREGVEEAAIELAFILAHGDHGVPVDRVRAANIAQLVAPWHWRLAGRLGLARRRWLARVIDCVRRQGDEP